MFNYMTAKEAAEKWKISQRRVSILCSERRIPDATMFGNTWAIPQNARKPIDKRTTRYNKQRVELRPFVKWVGGKGQLLKELENNLPRGLDFSKMKYAEPMVGGGALFFNVLNKYDFKEYYISDINPELINAYKVIQKNVEQLILELEALQASYLSKNDIERKEFYYDIRNKFNLTSLCDKTAIKKASCFIFLNKTCFNGLYRVNKKGHFNVPMGSYKKPTICDAENLRNINKVMQKVKIVYGDYNLSYSFIDKDTIVYFDPPYRPISNTSSFTSYNNSNFDDNEQIRLYEFVNKINLNKTRFILSNSDPKNSNGDDCFFDELYKNYKILRIFANRVINSKAEGRGKVSELLIKNF